MSMLLSSLTTDRLLLKPFSAADVGHMQLLDQDAEVVRYLGSGRVRSPHESAANLNKILSDYQKYELGLFAVYRKESGEFVGRSGLIPWIIDGELVWEIGYSFLREAWGRGYATECASSLKSWAERNLRAAFVISLIHPENDSSIHVAKKIGMRFDRIFKLGELSLSVYRAEITLASRALE